MSSRPLENKLKSIIDEIYNSQNFKQFQTFFENNYNQLLDLLCNITEIPSPTFFEDKKAEFVQKQMINYGLNNVSVDEQKNVIGRYLGSKSDKFIPIFAHIDTVFPIETELKVKKNNEIYSCPGIGDNSSSVAVMLMIIQAWKSNNYLPLFDVIFVANACEEGLGDLKGIKVFLEEYAVKFYPDIPPSAVLALDGTLGDITHIGVGSKRIKLTIFSEGGHSWGNFGNENSIHILSKCISDISSINVPSDPKTTFNVGLITGGTSINTIASISSCFIDMRSIDQKELDNLENTILNIIKLNVNKTKSKFEIEYVGSRPSAFLPINHPLINLAILTGNKFDIKSFLRASSTDANIPLSKGIPALTIGAYDGSRAHTKDEYMVPSSLRKGILYVSLLLMSIIMWIEKN